MYNHHLAAIFCFDHNFLNESNTGFFIRNFKTVCDFIVVESMGFIFFYSVCVIHVLLLFSDNSSNKKSKIKDLSLWILNIKISQIYRKSKLHVLSFRVKIN